MEEDIDVNEDDSYYPTDVEDDVEYVLGVEDILHESSGAHVPTSSTTMEDVYFHLSDFDSNFSSDEDMEHMCEKDGGWESNFMNPNFPHLPDEFSKPLFDHISIKSSPKFIQFTLESKDLMMLCLQKHKFPTFHEIREVDGNFRPLLTSYGRPIDVNDQGHIEQRWVKLQNNLKLIETIGGPTLSLCSDTKRREIPHIGIWSSIVSTFHIGPLVSIYQYMPQYLLYGVNGSWIKGLEVYLYHILRVVSNLVNIVKKLSFGMKFTTSHVNFLMTN